MKTKTTATDAASETNAAPIAPTPGLTAADLIARVRAAKTDEDAMSIVQPDTPRASQTVLYEVVAHDKPLPQKRGLSVRVWVAAPRLNKAFTAADIAAKVEGKNVPYWVRQLAKAGHFRPVVTA
jgi:hypothetical protein